MSARGSLAANGVPSPNVTPVEDREPRVTAVDTVHGDSARRGVAARSIMDEAITNERVVPRAEMGRGRGARDV